MEDEQDEQRDNANIPDEHTPAKTRNECLRSRIATYPTRREKQPDAAAALKRETTAEVSRLGRAKQKADGSAVLLPYITMEPILVADETIEKVEGAKKHSHECHDGTTECESHHA
jgi:hypothetical protein